METNRTFWHPSRSLLGLILFGVAAWQSIDAKELFDVPLSFPSPGFDYNAVNSVSFYFSGLSAIDAESMVKNLAKGKTEIIVTGKDSLDGAALSSGLAVYVTGVRNVNDKSFLVRIEASVNAVAIKSLRSDGNPYRGFIPVTGQILVFTDVERAKEVDQAVSSHLADLIKKITADGTKKTTLYLVQ